MVLDTDDVTNDGIMNPNETVPDFALYTSGSSSLSNDQIRVIQGRSRNFQDGRGRELNNPPSVD